MGGKTLAYWVDFGTGEGPQTIFRENLMRRKIVLCNVVGRDIAGFVEEARRKIAGAVELAPGYYVTFGGQFEGQQRALRCTRRWRRCSTGRGARPPRRRRRRPDLKRQATVTGGRSARGSCRRLSPGSGLGVEGAVTRRRFGRVEPRPPRPGAPRPR
jgi:hypothetical protein